MTEQPTDEAAARGMTEQPADEGADARIAAAEEAICRARLDAVRFDLARKLNLTDTDTAILAEVNDPDAMVRAGQHLAERNRQVLTGGLHTAREGGNPKGAKDNPERAFVRELFGNHP